MTERTKKSLYDILMCIEEIESYFKNKKRDFNDFKDNTMFRRAIERDLEIIGEATNRIRKENDTVEIKHVQRIVGLRNHISHAYDSIQEEIIWGIVIKEIPELKIEVQKLLEG